MNKQDIHVVLCADHNHAQGVAALMNSIAQNAQTARDASRIRVHLTTTAESAPLLRQFVDDHGMDPVLAYDVTLFDSKADIDFIQANMRVLHSDHIANVMNFARFCLGDLYPTLDRVIYLDADMIVQGDIAELWHLPDAHPCGQQNDDYVGDAPQQPFWAACWPGNSFNAGMFVTSLDYWRSENVKQAAFDWMKKHRESDDGLYQFGTQPVLRLIFPHFIEISNAWNTMGLGFMKDLDEAVLSNAKILHWNGRQKPWLPDGYYKHLWTPYVVNVDDDQKN